ncbi:unnamed protein product [Symbiodinium necroappetens]|uniref:Endonuclease/exonuclease/phosphatase domain-containing protein n=1 Tax=Symbiodinium necroappetens TaxID=1628268 RepID=A0A813ABP6_9DINO|nr:unnamed protein product [Symbiodinium necroappetens]
MPRAAIAVLAAALSLSLASPAAAETDGVKRIGQETANPRTPGTLRLASYNALNLFDAHDDPMLQGRNDDADDTKPDAEKKALAEAIRAIDADVIGMQEIESFSALQEFVDEYLSEMGYKHIVSIDVGQERGIENAVISRFPLSGARVWPGYPLGGVHPEKYGDSRNWYAGEPITFRRSPLMVDVTVPAETTGTGEPYEFTLFVVHHKSGYHNGYWREAEAETIVSFINDFQRDDRTRNIAVLGDFNAQAHEKSVGLYRERAGMTHALGHEGRDRKELLTHSSGRAIDFVLLNRAMAGELVEGSPFVFATPVRPEDADWRTTPAPEGYASDHMPVVVDLRLQDTPD